MKLVSKFFSQLVWRVLLWMVTSLCRYSVHATSLSYWSTSLLSGSVTLTYVWNQYKRLCNLCYLRIFIVNCQSLIPCLFNQWYLIRGLQPVCAGTLFMQPVCDGLSWNCNQSVIAYHGMITSLRYHIIE